MKGGTVLFGGNRLGYVGLAVVVSSMILALASPLVIVKFPDWWGVPADETIELTKLWPPASNNSRQFGYAPINHTIAVRIAPHTSELRSDRIFVAAGTRLYAVNPSYGTSAWSAPGMIDFSAFDPDPMISAGPVGVNFGDHVRGNGPFYVYVATQSGSVYAINDSQTGSIAPPPAMRIGVMDGPATGIAVYSGDNFRGFTANDTVVATSAKGTVYLWAINGAGHGGPFTISVANSSLNLAGQPMRGFSNHPQFSPAFYFNAYSRSRPLLFVGSQDGNLTAVNITDLGDLRIAWRVNVLTTAISWTTAPVVAYVPNEPVRDTVVFAGTDDGYLWALYAGNGTTLPRWNGPRHVGRTDRNPDPGKLTQPNPIPGTPSLAVGSSSGYAYLVDYLSTDDDGGNVHLKWWFRDFFNPEGTTYINSYPTEYGGVFVFLGSNTDKGELGVTPDDLGTLFALNLENGFRSWYVSFDSPIVASAVALETTAQPYPAVITGTQSGSVYAHKIAGLIIYNSDFYTCPEGGKAYRGTLCTKHADFLFIVSSSLAVAGSGTMAYAAVKGPRKPPRLKAEGLRGQPY